MGAAKEGGQGRREIAEKSRGDGPVSELGELVWTVPARHLWGATVNGAFLGQWLGQRRSKWGGPQPASVHVENPRKGKRAVGCRE